jgi:hypothetical protein
MASGVTSEPRKVVVPMEVQREKGSSSRTSRLYCVTPRVAQGMRRVERSAGHIAPARGASKESSSVGVVQIDVELGG